MEFKLREIQICGQDSYCFTDEKNPQIAVRTEGGEAEHLTIRVSHGTCTDWTYTSEGGVYFSYEGSVLQPKTRYTVQVTAEKEGKSCCREAVFDTGFMGTEWKASWIEPIQEAAEPERPIRFFEVFRPELRKEFHEERLKPAQQVKKTIWLEEIPKEAIVYATAHGIYRFQINGSDADDRRLAPEISVYGENLYYQRYDVARHLKKGENELLFTLADGWWCGRIGLTGDSCQYGSKLALLAELDIDGEIIGSDDTFLCREADARYADLYIGEKWDLTREKASWRECIPVDDETVYPKHNLQAQMLMPLKVIERIPGRLFETTSGDLLADFGQTLAGGIDITVEACGERVITLEHCEVLGSDGEFFQNIVGRNKQQRDSIRCEVWPLHWEARYTYHGFRYVRICGVKKEEIRQITANVIGTPVQFDSSFHCSNEDINQLQHNIVWSMKSNFFSIPTDCPQREKMGWTGDIQVFADTACENADVRGFLNAWLRNVRYEQRKDGLVPNYVPAFPISAAIQERDQGDNTSSAWGDACILVPLSLYYHTGDVSILQENVEMMDRWIAFVKARCALMPEEYASFDKEKKERYKYLWHAGHHFGDWLIPSLMDRTDGVRIGMEATGEVISSSFFAITLDAYRQVYQILGKDTKQIEQLLAKVRKAVREEYVQPDGRIQGDYQGLYVIALKAGIVEGELATKTAKRLVEKIQNNGMHLDTGFVTTPYLLDVLCENGYEDIAFSLLLQDTQPSWLYQVRMGATTVWENWTAVLPDKTVTESSMNHYALGSVGSWIYGHIGGIRKVDLERKNVHIQLNQKLLKKYGFTGAEIRRNTPFGTILFSWTLDQDQNISYTLDSPLQASVCIE